MVLSDPLCAELMKDGIAAMAGGGDKLTLDFHGVLAMDNAFGDAVFGELLVKKGARWLEDHVAIEGVEQTPLANMISRALARWGGDPGRFLACRS